MYWYHAEIGLVHDGRAFTLNGFQYPAGWLSLASATERTARGLLPARVLAKPDEGLYLVGERETAIVDGEAIVGHVHTPRDVADARRTMLARVKAAAKSALAPSDWKVIRAAEDLTKPVDQVTLSYRASVRATCDTAEADINACETVGALEALPPVVWPPLP